jgi:hypothetical protein
MWLNFLEISAVFNFCYALKLKINIQTPLGLPGGSVFNHMT